MHASGVCCACLPHLHGPNPGGTACSTVFHMHAGSTSCPSRAWFATSSDQTVISFHNAGIIRTTSIRTTIEAGALGCDSVFLLLPLFKREPSTGWR